MLLQLRQCHRSGGRCSAQLLVLLLPPLAVVLLLLLIMLVVACNGSWIRRHVDGAGCVAAARDARGLSVYVRSEAPTRNKQIN